MDIDLRSGTLTFRVLYAGPEGATKFSNLRSLHGGCPQEESRDISVLHASGDRIVSFLYVPNDEAPRLSLRVVFQVMTAPGKTVNPATQRLLLRAADAVIFLPERQNPGSQVSTSGLTAVLRELRAETLEQRIPVFVQNYSDGASEFRERDVLVGTDVPSVKILTIAGDSSENAASVFNEARRAVLARYDMIEATAGREGMREAIQSTRQRLQFACEEKPKPELSRWIVIVAAITLALAFLAWRITANL